MTESRLPYPRVPEIRCDYYDWFIGLDVGKRLDPSAICVLGEGIWDYEAHKFLPPSDYNPDNRARLRLRNHSNYWSFRPPDSKLYVTKLERFPLHTPYPDVADRVVQLAYSVARYGNTAVVIDNTGVGEGVADMLRERDVWPVKVNITAGEGVGVTPEGIYTASKNHLITKLDMAYQQGRLSFNPELPMLSAFEEELESFEEVRAESTGRLSYKQTRSSKTGHADLVLAASLALFFRNWYYSIMDVLAWEYGRQRSSGDPEDMEIYMAQDNVTEYWG
jgi:hypothetical protein